MSSFPPAPDYAGLRQQQRELAVRVELADALQSVPKKDSLTVSFFHLDEEILKKYPKQQIFETVYHEF